MQPMDVSCTARWRINRYPSVKGTKIGGFNKYYLILAKAIWHSFVHSIFISFIKSLNKGSHVAVNCAMKQAI